MSGIENDVLVAKNVNFDFTSNPPHSGIVTANGQLLIGSTADPNIAMVANTLTAGTGITVTNGPGTITVATTASLTDLHTAKYIVSSAGTSGTGANYTTINAAVTAAQLSGIPSTIFIQPGTNGTYTENFTLPANVNLVAYAADALTPNVTIIGNITCSEAGSRSISGIRLQTNSAAFLTLSENAAIIVNLDNCYLNCTNATGISYSSASASSEINITNCRGNLGTTGIGLFSQSSSGTLTFRYSNFTNSGGSSTASTCSAGLVNARNCGFMLPITFSGTGVANLDNTSINTSTQNAICLTSGGSASVARYCAFSSGTASAVSIGGTLAMESCIFDSSNANAVTGAGTLNYALLQFQGSSSTVNTSTQNPLKVGPKIYTTGGITFDGTNTLSTYTTGSWTPTLSLSTPGTSSFTYSSQVGTYTQIGNVVNIQARLVLTNFTIGTGSGNVQLGTLPVTANATNGSHITCSLQNITYGAGVLWYIANIVPSATNIVFSGNVSGTSFSTLQAAGLSNTSIINISGTYTA